MHISLPQHPFGDTDVRACVPQEFKRGKRLRHSSEEQPWQRRRRRRRGLIQHFLVSIVTELLYFCMGKPTLQANNPSPSSLAQHAQKQGTQTGPALTKDAVPSQCQQKGVTDEGRTSGTAAGVTLPLLVHFLGGNSRGTVVTSRLSIMTSSHSLRAVLEIIRFVCSSAPPVCVGFFSFYPASSGLLL